MHNLNREFEKRLAHQKTNAGNTVTEIGIYFRELCHEVTIAFEQLQQTAWKGQHFVSPTKAIQTVGPYDNVKTNNGIASQAMVANDPNITGNRNIKSK